MKDERKNAYEAYNQIADWYAENRHQGLMEKFYLDQLLAITGKGASVLDLGCGTGQPIINYLPSQEIKVTGIDASHRMLTIAKKNFPSTDFVQADIRQLSLGRKFDAIVAWHSFFQLPPEDQPSMFQIFKNHLTPLGILLPNNPCGSQAQPVLVKRDRFFEVSHS